MSSGLLYDLSEFAMNYHWEDLPSQVINDVKMILLDSFGCALAGMNTEPGKIAINLAKRLGGPEESSIIGSGSKVSCHNAAFVNGQLINALDYDAGPDHAPPFIIPPSLAIAEIQKTSGRSLILAIAIGFEISHRIGEALSMKQGEFEGVTFKWAERAGFAYCNFGAVAGVCKIMGFDYHKMANAMGIAGHLAQFPTMIQYSFGPHRPMTKYAVPGWQNMGAIMAALLTEMGYMGDEAIFDEATGFWKFSGYKEWHPQNVLRGIGKNWRFFNQLKFKPYPCCRMFQTELDMFMEIIQQNKLKPEDIETVKIYGHPTLEVPCFTNQEITNIVDIQFNPALIFSMAVHDIPRGVEWQNLKNANNPTVKDFAKKVSYQTHPDFWKSQLSKVDVSARGHIYSMEKPLVSLHSMSKEEVIDKFRHNALALSDDNIQKVIDLVLNLENCDDISKLMHSIKIDNRVSNK